MTYSDQVYYIIGQAAADCYFGLQRVQAMLNEIDHVQKARLDDDSRQWN